MWLSETDAISLTDGTSTSAMLARHISPMAVYLTTTDAGGTSTDRILYPISTFEYASLPNKTQSGPPTSYWYDRQETPQVVLWPVPDDAATYTLNLRILSQPEDATLPGGVTPNLPYRWFDAYTTALAARLASIYKPDLEDRRKADAERAWTIAAKEDIEYTPLYVIPSIGGYFR